MVYPYKGMGLSMVMSPSQNIPDRVTYASRLADLACLGNHDHWLGQVGTAIVFSPIQLLPLCRLITRT